MAVANVNQAPKKLKDPYWVKDADGDKKLIYPSRATLIVAATSLVGQWEIELKEKSTKEPRILKYYGKTRPNDAKELSQNYDFVLTTYGIMQRESGLCKSELDLEMAKRVKRKQEEKNLGKNGKKKGVNAYIPPSEHTLHHIEWNRVVLDESHSVKTIQNIQSKSCRNLKALHRWCLTGTPFNTSLKDLDGQLRFVGMVSPLDSAKWWEEQERLFTQRGIGSQGLNKQSASLLKVINACVMRHKKDQLFNGKATSRAPSPEGEVRAAFDVKIRERSL
eukprot:TRINITY_DN316_c0_g1_i7.p1 TRINITY_DN316_c0_g1~~TRINITY_DN316_c0_g1_i7.p1  ORF type:complete len:277 (-),score=45.43 TRINITY_DN316_c0_g1_i7:174-1004(-)